MDILKAVVLGIVQGIGEFLPISSSGHLVVVDHLYDAIFGRTLARDADADMLFNIVVHLGTLLSILIVYREEIWKLRLQPRVCLNIVLASIPAGILGVLFKHQFEVAFSTPLVVGVCWFITAAMLLVGQRLERNEISYEELPSHKAFFIGLFQAVALLPGVSRSGSTITGGLLSGLQRGSAGAFSFLMAIPVIGGATLLELKDVVTGETQIGNPVPLIVGGVTSFLVGWVVLRWLVMLIAKGRLHWFAYYCCAAGTATVIWQLFASVSEIGQAAAL